MRIRRYIHVTLTNNAVVAFEHHFQQMRREIDDLIRMPNRCVTLFEYSNERCCQVCNHDESRQNNARDLYARSPIQMSDWTPGTPNSTCSMAQGDGPEGRSPKMP